MPNLLCPWESAQYLFFSSSVPSILLYYSHGISVIFALVFGFLLIFKAKKDLAAKIFFAITLLFSVWVFLDLLLWAGNNPLNALFFWSMQVMAEIFIYIGAAYLCYVFIAKKDLSFLQKIILFFPIFPILILLPTRYLLPGVNIDTCVVSESNFIIFYSYAIEALFIISLIFLTSSLSKNLIKQQKNEVWLFTVGIILFLLAFSSGNIIGSITENWEMAQLGLFIMPIFIGILAYLVVKYQAFNIKLIAVQVLVWGLAILIGSQFFFIKVLINFILTGVTFVVSIVLGYFLIQSVKKEIKQKEELAVTNEQLSEFMSFASHEIKGPMSFIKGIVAMVLEGDLGELNLKLKEAMRRIYIRSNDLIDLTNQYMNKAKIELNQISYAFEDFDIGVELKQVVEYFQQNAKEQHITVAYDGKKEEIFTVKADKGKMKEVFRNIIIRLDQVKADYENPFLFGCHMWWTNTIS